MTFRSLLFKGITLILINLVLLGLLSTYLDNKIPYYWASSRYENKNLQFLNANQKYNTLFFGSSYTINAINPTLFDSLNLNKSHSFNMGIPFGVIPESFYWVENFIDNYMEEEHRMNLFFEINEIHPLKKYNNIDRFYYMLNNNSMKILWEDIESKDISFLQKLSFKSILVKGYLRNKLNIELLGNKIKYLLLEQEKTISESILENRGYAPAYEKSKEGKQIKKLISKVEKSRKGIAEINVNLISFANLLLKKANDKNINLVFLVLPTSIEKSTWALCQQLDQKYWIDLGALDSKLYEPQNRKNAGHLNDDGATILTNELVNVCQSRKYFE